MMIIGSAGALHVCGSAPARVTPSDKASACQVGAPTSRYLGRRSRRGAGRRRRQRPIPNRATELIIVAVIVIVVVVASAAGALSP